MFLALEFTTPAEDAARRWTEARVRAFITAAVELTGLLAINDPVGGEYDGRVMLLQLIAESHIAVHLMPQEPQPYGAVHVFSCRDFNEAQMIILTAEFFVADGGTLLPRSLPRGDLPELPHVPTA